MVLASFTSLLTVAAQHDAEARRVLLRLASPDDVPARTAGPHSTTAGPAGPAVV